MYLGRKEGEEVPTKPAYDKFVKENLPKYEDIAEALAKKWEHFSKFKVFENIATPIWAMQQQTTIEYLHVSNKMSWWDAEANCVSWGGHLTSVLSWDEQEKVASFSSESHWIGFNDLSVEGTFVWTDGSDSNAYTYWQPGEPNNSGGEHCTVLYRPVAILGS